MLNAPPNPWKYDELSGWLETSLTLGKSLEGSISNQLAMTEAAEKALEDFVLRSRNASLDFQRQRLSLDIDIEKAIEEQVFADLRQMMLIPALHTEYRRFMVLRDKDQITQSRNEYKSPKDSVCDLCY